MHAKRLQPAKSHRQTDGVDLRTPIVALADLPESGPVWQMLARSGTHVGRMSGRVVELSTDLIDALACDGKRRLTDGEWPIGAPVTVEHGGLRDRPSADEARSVGYIRDLEARADEQGYALWGLVDWTDEGREMVRGRKFQGMSIEYAPETGAFLGASLTNQPAVGGLSALAASDGGAMSAEHEGQIAALSDRAAKAEAEVRTLSDRAKKAEATVVALTDRLTAAEQSRDALQAEVDGYREKQAAADVETLVEEGRVTPTDAGRGIARKLLALSDLAGVREALPARTLPTERVSVGVPPAKAPVQLSDLAGKSSAEIAKLITAGMLTGTEV